MSPRTIAISGASGKTGFRIAEEVLAAGDQPRLLLRADSQIPASLEGCEQHRLSLLDPSALDHALLGADALVIATGARPHTRAYTRGSNATHAPRVNEREEARRKQRD